MAGRRILLITEQGFGDTMQFVRFAPLLKRQGAGAVILECPEKLVKLLSRTPGIDHLVPARTRTLSVHVAIAPGELIDKITILEIKAQRMSDPAKLCNVRNELESLQAARDLSIVPSDDLDSLTSELRSINEAL